MRKLVCAFGFWCQLGCSEDPHGENHNHSAAPGSSSPSPMMDAGAEPVRDATATGNAANCPQKTPLGGTDCDELALCKYDGVDCFCNLDGTWRCNASTDKPAPNRSEPGEPPNEDPKSCPESRPSEDADCPGQGLSCDFDAGPCSCEKTGWTCSGPDDERCPTPPPQDACAPVGLSCGDEEVRCSCTEQWDCEEAYPEQQEF